MLLLVLVAFIVALLYLFHKYLTSHWTRQGMAQGQPELVFGDFQSAFLHKESIANLAQKLYMKNKHHRLFGTYLSYRPILFVNDPKIIRDVILKDAYFPDRGVHANEDFDPLSEQLFFQAGQKWKKIRAKLTPAFTSGKLKAMLPIVAHNGQILRRHIEEKIESGESIFELRELVARLNTNIIAAVAFGIEVDTINDPSHVMRQMGVTVFEPNMIAGLRFFTAFFTPKINEIFKFKFVSDEVENFFKSIIEGNVSFREKSNYQRNDLMQTLIQLKNDGFVRDDLTTTGDSDLRKISLNDICAQSFGFYLGGLRYLIAFHSCLNCDFFRLNLTIGFETTSTTVSFCLHELAKNQDKQRRAQAEVDIYFKITEDGEEMYEIVKNMKYLEACMFETLRKYPPLPVLNRKCISDYAVPDSDLVIRKGTQILIPIFGLQRDSAIYEDPLEFIPERFLSNASGSDVDGMYYLPFGGGPRICIGHRMGKQNTVFQLALLLSKYHFELTTSETKEIEFNPNQLFLQPIGNIHLKVSLRKVK